MKQGEKLGTLFCCFFSSALPPVRGIDLKVTLSWKKGDRFTNINIMSLDSHRLIGIGTKCEMISLRWQISLSCSREKRPLILDWLFRWDLFLLQSDRKLHFSKATVACSDIQDYFLHELMQWEISVISAWWWKSFLCQIIQHKYNVALWGLADTDQPRESKGQRRRGERSIAGISASCDVVCAFRLFSHEGHPFQDIYHHYF